jgi:Uma2 family endonuclease
MLSPRRPAPISVEDFLAWEATQEDKWELVDGEPVLRRTRMMAGGTHRHALLAANIIIALGPRLRGGPCRALTSDIKVRSDDAVRYPDVTVDCGTESRSLTAQTPKVLFEVLSPSNSTFQQTRLLADYQAIETVEEIVFISQDAAEAQSWRRVSNGWTLHDHQGLEGEIPIQALGFVLTMAEIYDGADFDPPLTREGEGL